MSDKEIKEVRMSTIYDLRRQMQKKKAERQTMTIDEILEWFDTVADAKDSE